MTNCTHTTALDFRSATASGGNNTGPNCVQVAPFRSSARSAAAGHCVQVAVAFSKATASVHQGACVEVGFAKAEKSTHDPMGGCVEVGFAKATDSVVACVEVGHAKAEISNPSGNCVEPGQATADEHTDCTPETCLTPGIEPGDVVVRDSKLGEDSPLIVFKHADWDAYVERVLAGDTVRDADGGYLIHDPRPTGIVLTFTENEWVAFLDGCSKDEFKYAPLSVPA